MSNPLPKLLNNTSNEKDLNSYLEERGTRHKYYRLYGKISRLSQNLLIDKVLYLSDGSKWNDVLDSQAFCVGNKLHFGKCFSYSSTESVAMWLLYGGLDDDGAMYCFTSNYINSIVKYCKTIELGNFKNGTFEKKEILNKGKNEFNIYLRDALYYSENKKGNSYLIQHDNERKNGVKKDVVNDGAKYVLKQLPWSYENEVRLIVEINKEKDTYNLCDTLKIDLGEIEKIYKEETGKNLSKANNRLYCSPNLANDQQLINLDVRIDKIKIYRSKLTGLISWNILNNNNKLKYDVDKEKNIIKLT